MKLQTPTSYGTVLLASIIKKHSKMFSPTGLYKIGDAVEFTLPSARLKKRVKARGTIVSMPPFTLFHHIVPSSVPVGLELPNGRKHFCVLPGEIESKLN